MIFDRYVSTQSRRWMFGRIFGLYGRESYRELRPEPLCCPHRLSLGTVRMNESIDGERTASELQDRVTELIEQQTAISDVLRAMRARRTTCSPSSTPSSTAPHVSVEQT
jgi:hypothetical protein